MGEEWGDMDCRKKSKVHFLALAIIHSAYAAAAASAAAIDDPLASYPAGTCLCQLDPTLKYVLGEELALQVGQAVDSSAALVNYTQSQPRSLSSTGYWVPSRDYLGVQISSSSRVPSLCTCLAEGVLVTRLVMWNRPWVDSMADPHSTDFQAMVEEIEKKFTSLMIPGPYGDEFVAAYLTKLEQGAGSRSSTIATVDVQSSIQLDAELVRQYLYKMTSLGTQLGTISMDPPYFAPVQGSSASYRPEALVALLNEAKDYAISLRTSRLKPDDTFKYFYYITCPAAGALGFLVLICLCGLSEKGCLCRNVTTLKK